MRSRRLQVSRVAATGTAVLGLAAVAGAGSASAAVRSNHESAFMKAAIGKVAAMRRAEAGHLAVAAGAAMAPPVTLHSLALPSGAPGMTSEVLSPNGKMLYVATGGLLGELGGGSGGVYGINLSDPSASPVQIMDGGSPISGSEQVALSPNGKTLYIAAADTGGSSTSGVLVANVGGGTGNDTVVNTLVPPSGTTPLIPLSVAVSSNGKRLYLGGLTEDEGSGTPTITTGLGTVSMTSATVGTLTSMYTSNKIGLPAGLSLSPNGDTLYAANVVGAGSATAMRNGKPHSTTALPEVYGASNVAVSPDGRTLYDTTFNYLGIELGSEGLPGVSSNINTFAIGGGGHSATLAGTSLFSGEAPTDVVLNESGTMGYATRELINVGGGTTSGGIGKFTVPAAATKVTIDGKASVGSTVMAKVKGASGGSDSYAWMANGKKIKGATKASLKLGSALKGKKLSVMVTATAVGYHMATLTSSSVTVK